MIQLSEEKAAQIAQVLNQIRSGIVQQQQKLESDLRELDSMIQALNTKKSEGSE